MLDVKTGKPLDRNSPTMKTVLRIWFDAPFEEQKAFHAVCVLNSREAEDLERCKALTDKMAAAMNAS